jgi:predicted nucleic acid-binding protein
VVDASVAVKWFLPEIHSDAALRLIAGEHSLNAPDLIFSEFGNVLWKRIRRSEISKPEADSIIDAFLSVPIRVQSSQHLVRLAVEIASGENQTVYDGLYVAAAVVLDIPLVTADAKLYRSIRRSPLSSHVVWIEDAA